MLTRVGARTRDWIYVTGPLGGSLLGKHHRFSPRLDEGAWLAAQRDVRAMTDLSDGLAKDLRPLTPHGSQPALDPQRIPISRAAKKLALSSGRTPLDHALGDGEDYELLFTLRRRADQGTFERAWRRRFGTPLHCLGCFASKKQLPAGALDLRLHHGYEHLR
jgi:thiamine-monophosphate kinase